MKLFTRIKTITLLVLITCISNSSYAQCTTSHQVTHMSGSVVINGINVTVTSSGNVMNLTTYCPETLPYLTGYAAGPGSGTGSFTFNFVPAVDSVRLNFSGLSNSGSSVERIILRKNGVHYAIPAPGTANGCDALAVLTASGDVEGCVGCGVSGWKGTRIGGPISQMVVVDTVISGTPNGALFSLFFANNCPLPVQFTACNAGKDADNAVISWQTSQESNSYEYEIYRSADGNNFSKIGSVASKNNPSGSSYSFSDKLPLSGVNYYRVNSKDRDGKTLFCTVNRVVFPVLKKKVNVYPVPASDILYIENNFRSIRLNIEVIDMVGRTVMQTSSPNSFPVNLPVGNLPKGAYTLKIIDGQDVIFRKFVKQ